MESPRYTFTAPLGPIEKDDLRWYLESYFVWPVGVFKDRAEEIERKLPDWGRDLFRAALGAEEAREAFFAWQHTSETAERRFSVLVDDDPPLHAEAAAGTATGEAAAELLALPWELLHDGRTWLFQGGRAVRIRHGGLSGSTDRVSVNRPVQSLHGAFNDYTARAATTRQF